MNSPEFFALCLLLLCSVYVGCECSYNEHDMQYNIIPSSNIPCPENPCLTLSQVAAYSSISYSDNVKSLSLFFLPGNHSLDRELYLTEVNRISMAKDTNTTVIIECNGSSGRFIFSNISYALIRGLHFVGCGGNIVTQISQFVVEDTIFQGVEGRGTALVLNDLLSAAIARSWFLSNTQGDFKHGIDFQPVLDCLSQELGEIDSETVSIGGAFYSVSSNIAVESTIFEGNSAELFGGAITAEDSGILIKHCRFMSNKAGNDTSELITGFGTIFSYNSDIRVHGSMFVDNIAATGGVLLTYGRRIHISSSTFSNNRATKYGGVIDSKLSSCDIINSNFSNNSAFRYGGVIAAWQSTFNISNNSFTSNSVSAFTSNNAQLLYGGVMNIRESSFTVTNSRTFADNSGGFGGVTAAWNSSITIYNNMFTTNSASSFGGVMAISASSVNATVSTFANNSAASYGGVLYSQSYSSFEATDSSFIDNAAQHGGVIYSRTSSFNISGSIFINNSAPEDGGVMTISSSSFNIVNNSFVDNRAGQYGGVIQVERNPFFYIISSTFYGNNAQYGGVLSMFNSTFHVSDSHFINNSAQFYGGIICTFQSVLYVINSTFYHNSGSLYIFYSYLYFYGFTTFENCVEPPSKGPIGDALIYQEGGAITSFLSHIYYVTKKANLSNNKARNGGAVLAIESAIVVYYDSEVILAYNRAISGSGGGISLYQSSLVILGDCSISHCLGMQGGGIHASSSFITAYQEGQLQLISNSAKNGGGVYLEKNSELYLVKYGEPTSNSKVDITVFSANNATYGGAVFVADDTSTGTCLPMVECFFQTIAVFPQSSLKRDLNTVNIIFSENIAEYGSSLFGGLLDRCIPSPLAEIYHKHSIINNGLAYLGNISNITLDAISSPPVQVCFCSSDGQPDCGSQLPTIRVKKGETFTISLLAIDQVNHSVGANITASTGSVLGEGQQNQEVKRTCTELMFSVFSSVDTETITLYANGPCGDSSLSIRQVKIQFLNCTCPIGFKPSSRKTSTCECNCDSTLFPYITTGNATTSFLFRVNTNSWISYTNSTHPPGYIIHSFCPVGYCHPSSVMVHLDLNIPGGADAQCAYNHTGVLCGACQKNLSLSLGSSRCVSCYSHWPVVFVAILLAAITAGILLVTLVLFLNMTVAIGLINGFIFYANIVAASSTVFFPSSEPNFPKVFIAWLNLDIGLDVCFFDGLDEYAKVWLQLAFPLYILSLVMVIIILSKFSPRLAGVIGKKDPVAALATLILLSYSKLLSIIISALAFAVLQYPDGSKHVVWLPDGNVKYFQGKHIVLIIMAMCIILIGIPYTVLLLIRQWILWTPRWKIIRWTNNVTKFNHFISTYHVPYHSQYHYWTGLLLLVRILVYITASISASSNPQTSLAVISILVGGLFFLGRMTGVRVYQKPVVDIVNTVLHINLLIFAVLSLYHMKEDTIKQTVLAYISVSITFILLVGVIVYHVALLIKKDNTSVEVIMNEYALSPIQSANLDNEERVTYSVVELPKTTSDSESHNDNSENTEECSSSYSN